MERCFASESAASIPFGALSYLIPPAPSSDVLYMLEEARTRAIERADGRRFVLVVDDAHHLDEGSMTLIHRFAASSEAAVLLTRRTAEPGHEGTITSLWKDGHVERFDIAPVERAAHDELAVVALGAVRAAGVLDRLWRLTLGNPLFLREIVSVMANGRFEEWSGGELDEQTPKAALARLTDIVRSKTRRLPERERTALDVIAMAEPLSADLVADLCGADVLARLQAQSMVVIDDLGGVDHARTAHPVYGATTRAMLPSPRRSRLAASLADTLIARGLPQPGDALRAATWMRGVGRPLPAEIAVLAAEEALARGDAGLAEAFAGAAVERREEVSGLVALGTAMSVQHKSTEAESVLERALAIGSDEDELVRAALACARHHAWVGRDFRRGVDVIERTMPRVSSANARSELRAELAFFSAASGDAGETIRRAGEVVSDADASSRAVLSALVHSTRARVMLGESDSLDEELARGEALAVEMRSSLPLALDQLTHNRVLWLRFVDLEQARRVAQESYERSLREGGASGMWSGTLGWLAIQAGDLDAAIGLMERTESEIARFDPFQQLHIARSIRAFAHAVRGEHDTARAWLREAGSPEAMEPRSRVWSDRAHAWALTDDPEKAASVAAEAGERAEAATIMTWGAAALYHDAVRMDHAHLSVEALARIASRTTAPIIGLMADHARAAVERDSKRLALLADAFLARGSPLFAAEVLAQAAQSAGATATERARMGARGAHLASACPDAATPLLARLASPLSDREWEVARLASSGAHSREIAARLVISVRTVDNHLAAVYRKLGVSGREELSTVFS